jgi:two-component system response regulator HydG
MASILIIDDDPDICLLLKKYFTKKGFEALTASTGSEGITQLKKTRTDVVLCDFKLPDYNGIEILQKIKIIDPSIQVIIITGYSEVRTAVDALKKGAFEYVTKPLYPDEILLTVKSALEKGSDEDSQPKSTKHKANRKSLEFVQGNSRQSLIIQKHIELIAPTDMTVVILGETGTGKEYVARAIHDKSKRKDAPFVAIDCGALPKELAGSELFGHVKGAFTGAIQDKKGCFELADKGTLFLDEIGNLSYENQMKLLRVLQENMIKKLGGTKEIPVDVRIIVATNENLVDAVRAGDFREDIYHRFNEFKIEISPLRERSEDIITFANYFLNLANDQLNKEIEGFEDAALSHLKHYYWHGNLRELRNVVKRAVLLCQDKKIGAAQLPIEITQPLLDENQDINVSFNGSIPQSLKVVVEQAEKKAILEVLKYTNNNKSKTAEMLDVDRKTLYNKLKTYKIDI